MSPITREQFEAANIKKNSTTDKIAVFLDNNSTRAFSSIELKEMFNLPHSDAVLSRMSTLIKRGRVSGTKIGRSYYWISSRSTIVKGRSSSR